MAKKKHQTTNGLSLQVASHSLARALAQAAVVAEAKSTMPILGAALVEATITPDGGRLAVTAYDMEVAIEAVIACEVTSPGRIAIPAKLLREIAKRLPGNVAVLRQLGPNRVEVTCDQTVYEVACFLADDFPVPVEPDPDRSIRMSAVELLAAIDATRIAASNDETRYNLCGVRIEANEAGIRCIATDGHRLALADSPAPEGDTTGLTVPLNGVDALRRILLDAGDDAVDIGLASGSIVVRRPGMSVLARLVDGPFPEYGSVIPKKAAHEVEVSRGRLLDALDRVGVIGGEKNQGVDFALRKNVICVSAEHIDHGTASETIVVEHDGKRADVRLNLAYVLDALKALDSDTVRIGISTVLDPVLFTSEGRTHVVMPMRADEKQEEDEEAAKPAAAA